MKAIINAFANEISKDQYNDFNLQEAKGTLNFIIQKYDNIPSFILEGDYIAFRCAYAKYTPKQALNDFDYLLDLEDFNLDIDQNLYNTPIKTPLDAYEEGLITDKEVLNTIAHHLDLENYILSNDTIVIGE